MKNKIQIFFAAAAWVLTVLVTGCDNNYDRVFNESTDARTQAAVNEQTALLTSAPNGWKASLLTGSGIRYFYYFNFNADGTVSMLSDFNETTAGTPKSSLWTVKTLQTTTLSFTTYSYIHLPADPTGGVNGGTDGEGRISDSEFAFAGTVGDSLVLEGIQRGSRITFLKATAAEQALVLGGRIKDILHYGTANKALKLSLSKDKAITFAFNANAKSLTAQYVSDDGTAVVNNKVSYVISMDGLVLSQPIKTNAGSVQSFLWDADNSRYYAEIDGARKSVDVLTDPYFFKPSILFSSYIGTDYLAVRIPFDAGSNPLPGQSTNFTGLWNTAAESLQSGQYNLTLSDIFVIFDKPGKKMYVVVTVSRGQDLFLCQYNYSYAINASGKFKFTYTGADENGDAIANDMVMILQHFDNETFAGEYVGGGVELLGGFFSQESPEFSFTGYLTN
ncbi:DUF4302 domain-containing protein [Chryseolinea lacunae]|uniref:DUF4302 domain-containing protein n=1 Tax=Chryseolinea lacunae TaxID=2801331 RepID=A0ABS1KLT0_9BACT|nr:DUF4302 domain-containing protein [Chryseolinea lacunae]MBL0740415.1 DUF4302 domain-containing protein [Chryseolinea lacunae]